jgi:AcrR family transcriptional regulator
VTPISRGGAVRAYPAVSYHFGSLKALYDAAIAHALERYLDAQEDAVSKLGPRSTLEELAAAFARPMMRALAAGGRDLDVMRIVARGGIDPPEAWDRLDPSFDRTRADVVRVLKAGLLNWLALAPLGGVLRSKSERQIERWLVPVLAGAFRGTSTG